MILSFFSLFIWTFVIIYFCTAFLFLIFGDEKSKNIGLGMGFIFGGVGSLALSIMSFLLGTAYPSYEINNIDKDDVNEITYFDTQDMWYRKAIVNNTNEELYVYEVFYEDPKTHYRKAESTNPRIVQTIPAKSTVKINYTFLKSDILSMPQFSMGAFVDHKIMTKQQIAEFKKMMNN